MGVVAEKTHVIEGITYTTKTFPTGEGLILLPRLINLLGESAATLFFGTGGGELEALMDEPSVVAALMTGVAKNAVDDKHGGWLIAKDLLRNTTADKVTIGDNDVPGSVHTHFDTHFAGRYGHLLQVCMWVAQASFTRL